MAIDYCISVFSLKLSLSMFLPCPGGFRPRGGRWGRAMGALFAYFLSKLVRVGQIEVRTADGPARTFGDGTGPLLAVTFTDRAAERQLMRDPALALGELYMDGRMIVTHGDLYDVLELGARNLAAGHAPGWVGWLDKIRIALRNYHQRNDRRRAQAQHLEPLRSRPPALRSVSGRRPAIFLRLFRASGPEPRRGATGEEAPHRRQAADRRTP